MGFLKNAAGECRNLAYKRKFGKRKKTRCFLLCRANQENWTFHALDYRQTVSAKPRKQTSSHSGQISRASLVQSIRYFCPAFDTKLILRLERFEPPTLRSESEGNAILTTHLGQVRHVPLRATGNKDTSGCTMWYKVLHRRLN